MLERDSSVETNHTSYEIGFLETSSVLKALFYETGYHKGFRFPEKIRQELLSPNPHIYQGAVEDIESAARFLLRKVPTNLDKKNRIPLSDFIMGYLDQIKSKVLEDNPKHALDNYRGFYKRYEEIKEFSERPSLKKYDLQLELGKPAYGKDSGLEIRSFKVVNTQPLFQRIFHK